MVRLGRSRRRGGGAHRRGAARRGAGRRRGFGLTPGRLGAPCPTPRWFTCSATARSAIPAEFSTAVCPATTSRPRASTWPRPPPRSWPAGTSRCCCPRRWNGHWKPPPRPANWPRLANPFRPSWGEPYASIAARMLSVMDDAAEEARGHEAVCVSHQLPIWVARRAAEERRLWHHPGRRECALGSVTSFTYTDGKIIAVSYAEPSVGGRGGAHGA